jgi:hypothetical protein
MTGFHVPFALDRHGRLVSPENAIRRATYACPECRSTVDLHAGDKKRRHFHHRPGERACGPESASHTIAKRLVVQAIADWKDGGPAPMFQRTCAASGCDRTSMQPMPRKVQRAQEERALRSGRVVDVALIGPADLCIAAIEILCTHEVDEDKARALDVPWMEATAEQICATAGRVLVPVQDHLLPWLCEAHAPIRRDRARREREDALLRASLVRALPFRLEQYPDFRVEGVGRCPRGHDGLVFAWSGTEPPWPRPPLVVARQNELDWSFDGARGRLRAHLPFRRRYVTACPTCGQPLALP